MLGLDNPLGLLALASVAVLVALTLRSRRSRTIAVSSLMLWKQLRPRRLERQRFRPDLLFVLRLLLLLALVGGYVRPSLRDAAGGGARGGLAVVLDVSASMQVREPRGTRFELARRALDGLLSALPPDAPVLLVTAADRPRVALRWSADRGRLAEALTTIAPLDTPTALAPAVELALGEAARRSGARVAVLTDLAPAASALTAAELAAVDWTAVGARDDNVAIGGLEIEAAPFAEARDARAGALLHNFGAAARTVTLEASLDGTPWVRHAVALPARGARRVPLGAPPGPGLLRVRLAGDDALAVDDEAVGWVPQPPPLDVLVVSESDAFAAGFRALVASTGHGHVEVVNRAGLDERAGAAAGAVTVFDRLVPEVAGPGGVLYVAPPPGNAVCPAARVVDDAAVIDWEADHPVLATLAGLQGVEAPRAVQLLRPSWGTTVVTAASRQAAYPFLVVGEVGGRRRACLAAELPARLATSDTLPLVLLTLGTLRWLAEPLADAPIAAATGVPVRISGDAVAATDGVRVAGDPAVVVAQRAGVQRVRTSQGGDRLVLANLFDAAESDVGRDGGGVWPATTTAAPATGMAGSRELSWWFYAAAAALLALEWAVWGIVA
jgi:hypothetical protein